MSDILQAGSLDDLREVLAVLDESVDMTDEEIARMFKLCEALWYYQRPISPERPHVVLRNTDYHSDFFVNCMDALKEPDVLTALANQMCLRWPDLISEMRPDDWIIGTERAGAPICQEMARQIGCRHATVEKDQAGNPTVFSRFEPGAGRRALLVNDLLSHDDGSTYMSLVAVQQAWPGIEILPAAFHLVNRSGKKVLADGQTAVWSLLSYEAREYHKDDCELCQGGSKAMKFKANKADFLASA